MRVFFKILSPVIIIAGLYLIFKSREIKHPPGILAPLSPVQKKLDQNITWNKEGYTFHPVREFEATSRVLGIKFYGSDDMSDFCPVDLALGWGRMSDQAIIDEIDIKQQHRWYVWSTKKFPIPQKEIEQNSANVHIVPANDSIEDIIDDIIRGNVIKIKGKLVDVISADDNSKWKTSIRRDDTGGGACEIIWLDEITILK